VVAVGAPVVAMLLPLLSTIDLAYQIRAGDLMLETGSLLREDPFSYTARGRPWVDQQWGAQVLFAAIHRVGGWPLLIVTRAVLAGVVFWLVFLACRAQGAGRKVAALLTMGAFGVSLAGLILRPQLLGLALFALVLWILANRRRRPAGVWLIPPLVAVWANLHGSFFLGVVLAGLAYLQDRSERTENPARMGLVAIASAVAANLNPFGIRIWSYAFGLSTNSVITDTIVEWRPPTLRMPLGIVFFVSVAGVVALLARRTTPTPWIPLLTLGIFFFVGLFAVRGIFWWALAAATTLAGLLDRPAADPGGEPRLTLNTGVALLIGLLAMAFLPWWRAGDEDASLRLLDHAPPGVTAALRGVLEPRDRMFNPQIWGSWFEFALPEHLVFVDPRIEVFPARVWLDYDSVSAGAEGWQDVLDRWKVTVVVAERTQQGQLIPRIREDPGWRLVHEDEDGLVFLRR
jgi:hypothetical protein